MKRILNYYRSRRLVLVGDDFHSEGGAWRSIHRYFRHAEAQGDAVMLIDRRRRGTFRQLLCAVLFSPKILVNGLGMFYRWEGVLACLLRRDALVYLHDTAYMLGVFARQHPWKYRLFRRILRRNPVLCVSESMQAYYRQEFGADRTHVVREAVALPEPPDFDANRRHIVMVGSMDERKGAPLFSAVAAMAAAKHFPWRFHWVGGLASQSLGEPSQHVCWWGWQDAPLEFTRRADVFFLSSLDDPLPLACLEAIALGKRCVAYRKTGIAGMIDGIRGCAVLENHTADDALRALEKVLAETPDSERLARLVRENLSVPAFAARLDRITGR